MKKSVFTILLCMVSAVSTAKAGIIDWQQTAQSIEGSVKADTNNGAGYDFNGSAGIAYDYGDLDAAANNGGAVEFIFNFKNYNTSSKAFGSFQSDGGPVLMFKHKQGTSSTEHLLGLTVSTIKDHSFDQSISAFDEDTHVVYVERASDSSAYQQFDLYVNGEFVQSLSSVYSKKFAGGSGFLGSGKVSTEDQSYGVMLGVGTYDRELSAAQIAGLYNSFKAETPEPATLSLLALGGIAILRRKRKLA